MASFPCPYCGRAVAGESDLGRVEQCPSCAGNLVLGYRYRLVGHRGKVSGGELYEGVDDIFGSTVAVLFAADANDRRAVAGFVEGNRLFGELGGGRGLVKLRDLGTLHDRRPHAVMDWMGHGTLEQVVRQRGPLDPTTLHELVSDLLVGLGKAHRSMPSLVHGHIHPGKIGFVSADQAVLFGFEYARQVFEQDSHLADAFVRERDDESSGPTRASDLQQLGISLFYAATGEWPGKQALHEQLARVQQRLSGQLGTVFARMIGAGTEQGYSSAIEALIDYDHLSDGTSQWQARTRTHSTAHQAKLDAAAWTPSRTLEDGNATAGQQRPEASAEPEELDESEPEELEPEDFEDKLADILESESPPPVTPHYAVAAQHGHTQAQPWRPPPAKPAGSGVVRLFGVIIGSMVAFGMCVAALVSEPDRSPPPEPVVFTPPVVQPISIPEPTPIPEPVPEQPVDPLAAITISSIHRYEGKVTGPGDRAGINLGTRCEIWVEPVAGSLNCRFYIDCGKKRVYGGGDVGFSNCAVIEGHPAAASDEEMDAPDGAFMAVLAGPDPMVLVQDRWLQPPVRALISIREGGPHEGPIPDVKQAKRMSREQIEAAILGGELPEF